MSTEPETLAFRPDAPLPALAIVAIAAEDFAPAQRRLIELCDYHIREQSQVAAEMDESLAIAKRNKWRQRGIARAAANAKKIVIFYSNIKAALEAGYFLMPNLACDVYAVRTNQPDAVPDGIAAKWSNPPVPRVDADRSLPPGEGEYVSDIPLAARYTAEREEGGRAVKEYMVEPFATQAPDAPLILARPKLMAAAERAMALRIFVRPLVHQIVIEEGLDPLPAEIAAGFHRFSPPSCCASGLAKSRAPMSRFARHAAQIRMGSRSPRWGTRRSANAWKSSASLAYRPSSRSSQMSRGLRSRRSRRSMSRLVNSAPPATPAAALRGPSRAARAPRPSRMRTCP